MPGTSFELSDVERLAVILDDVIADWDDRDKAVMQTLFARAGQASSDVGDEVSGFSFSWGAPADRARHAIPPGPCDKLFQSFTIGRRQRPSRPEPGVTGRAEPPAPAALSPRPRSVPAVDAVDQAAQAGVAHPIEAEGHPGQVGHVAVLDLGRRRLDPLEAAGHHDVGEVAVEPGQLGVGQLAG